MATAEDDGDELALSFQQGIQSESGHWYNSLQRLGKGGNAVTYLTVASGGPYAGIPFAVKIFRKVAKPERRESFLEEMRFFREQNHPGIMRTFDEGIYRDDHPFVVAEYLPQTIAQVVRSNDSSMVGKVMFCNCFRR